MTDGAQLHVVRLLQVPLDVRNRSTEHIQGLLREFELILGGRLEGVSMDVPKRLLDSAGELERAYAPQVAAANAEYEAAAARGESVVAESTYRVPAEAAAFALHIIDVLEEVDEFCRSGRFLLTMAPDPDVAAYRRWTLLEISRQIEGRAPTPWPDFVAYGGSH
ncbi:MAG: ATP-binding region ATPase domain protein [Frankiales bacterium]|nr:ATP-binding region ATPase domain protein [Frankiales bacterium]